MLDVEAITEIIAIQAVYLEFCHNHSLEELAADRSRDSDQLLSTW